MNRRIRCWSRFTCCRSGALFAGGLFASHFIGVSQESFWKGALYYGPNNHILEEMEHVPEAVKIIPMLLLAGGFAVAWFGYIHDIGAPARWVRANSLLYNFVSHKWYFDELYDAIFVKPAFFIGRLFWRGGDMGIIDRFGPRRYFRRRCGRDTAGRESADGLHLPLCLRHADRRHRAHNLVSRRRGVQ